ncbi:MAG: extracellular solute-binding protein, partial [Candidatus Binatia bacterium]
MTRLRPVVHYPWLALALMLAGCGGRGDGPIELRLWAMGREGEVVERLLPAFHARHPGVRVRVQQVPWSAAHEKLLTAYVGDAMPDVFQVGTTWIAELVALGAVAPLDQRLASVPALRDDTFAGIAAANAVAGVAYAVPWYVDTRLLFYRTDRLRAAGYAAPPADWATWAAAMTAVRDQAGAGHYALLLPVSEWQPPVILALQRGAGLLRDGDRYGDFQSPAFRAAFAFYLSLFADGLAPAAAEGQVANLYQDFARGFFSFYVTGPWNIGEFAARLPAELAGAWSTAPMPGPEPGQPGLSIAGGASLAIAPSSPHGDAAWELITYLAEPATQVEFYRLTG